MKKPRRKRFTIRKRHSQTAAATQQDASSFHVPNANVCTEASVESSVASASDSCTSSHSHPVFQEEGIVDSTEANASLPTCSGVSVLTPNFSTSQSDPMAIEHGYAKGASSAVSNAKDLSDINSSQQHVPTPIAQDKVSQDILLEVKKKLEPLLHPRLLPIVHRDSIHVVLLSTQSNLSIQRTMVFSPSGAVELFVHCQPIEVKEYVKDIHPPVCLNLDNVNEFVDRTLRVINNIMQMEICGGYDDPRYKSVWSVCPFGKVDENPYNECRYVETFRSLSCRRLVTRNKWRCCECKKLFLPLKRRLDSACAENPHVNTKNMYLTEKQKLAKLQDQQSEIYNTRKKLTRLQARMQEMISKEGVHIDSVVSNDLLDICRNSTNLSPAQAIFLQQQVKASQKRNMTGMRWHPTMIRLALSLLITSPAAYKMLQDTGMVKLPSTRTLFDYSHVMPVDDGIDHLVLDSLSKRMKEIEKPARRYMVVMADEMHICQNLVFQKSSGKLIGYTKLDEVDREVKNLEKQLDKPEEELEETIATKVLVYMVKGVAAGVKEVVATYPVANPSVDQLYVWTWQVIGALERSSIPIIAFVCDGFSTNRAFIRKHIPSSIHPSGIVYDTVNRAARHRKLFFISDVPHLLKTVRNCFLNSRWSDRKKSRRKMMTRGKRISWDYIIKLFELHKKKSLRKTFKLNPMNVFPDSYARMKVKYAAQVISRTVAQDLEDRGWSDASETINFLRTFNDWFDCLNGPHSSVSDRKRNANLRPYTKDVLGENPADKRFEYLDSVLDYLTSWKDEALNVMPNNTLDCSTVADSSALCDNVDDSEVFEGIDGEAESVPGSRRMLSRETLEGIQMSTLAIKGAIIFLLEEGLDFINPRVFTQDPLEQHFGKIRAGQGGSNNPNALQVLNRNRALHTIGQLGMKRRGNVSEASSRVEVTTDPLPKRKCQRQVKFTL